MWWRIRNFCLLLSLAVACPSLASEADPWIRTGNEAFLSGKMADAAQAYEKALKTEPKNARVLHNIARCYERLGKKDKAAQAYRRLLALEPGNTQALEALERLKPAEAKPTLQPLPSQTPSATPSPSASPTSTPSETPTPTPTTASSPTPTQPPSLPLVATPTAAAQAPAWVYAAGGLGLLAVFGILGLNLALARRAKTPEGLHGTLKPFVLPDLLQMLALGQKTGILKVTQKKQEGRIFLEHGNIVGATFDHRRGEDAIHGLLELHEGGFIFYEEPIESNLKNFETTVSNVLMNWAHRQDEGQRPDKEPSKIHKIY